MKNFGDFFANFVVYDLRGTQKKIVIAFLTGKIKKYL